MKKLSKRAPSVATKPMSCSRVATSSWSDNSTAQGPVTAIPSQPFSKTRTSAYRSFLSIVQVRHCAGLCWAVLGALGLCWAVLGAPGLAHITPTSVLRLTGNANANAKARWPILVTPARWLKICHAPIKLSVNGPKLFTVSLFHPSQRRTPPVIRVICGHTCDKCTVATPNRISPPNRTSLTPQPVLRFPRV